MITVLTLAGTGEPQPERDRVYGMPSHVTRELDTSRFDCVAVQYPASYGPAPQLWGIDYEASVELGLARLISAIRFTDNLVGVIAYSQGATVLTMLLERMAAGQYPDVELAFAALIANPLRAPDWPSIDGSSVGYGIAGAHAPWPTGFPVWEVANPRDPIPCCPANSPLRGFADLTARFSFSDPARWGVDLVERAIQHRHSQRFEIGWWSARRAVDDALNYLVRGQHSAYLSMPVTTFQGRTYCEELARLINTQVRE
ncbi:PE-PPE domain-containing protein [Nocardia ninae]|uniref:PE-PPE domain-containing protein n=1 Tax=Nocardia ninae NBRC 108245 TaxID=1210091 RepID=A0A511MA59_9NOCA|nr:hypothetical protein NN4_19980 [Nocardia ninae NBRC 108245]